MAALQIVSYLFVLGILHVFALSSSVGLETRNRVNETQPLSLCENNTNPTICSAGRRMYKLLSYDVNQSRILTECYAACNESYSGEGSVSSCEQGCQLEVHMDQQRQSELTDYASLMHQARMQQMLSHWMFEMLAGFDFFNDWYDASPEDSREYATYVIIEQSDSQLRISSYRVAESYPEIGTSESPDDSGPLNPYADSQDEDFESCLSRTGYSRWVLCMLLFSSGLFLIWLTCSTVTTAPKQRVKQDCETPEGAETDEKLPLKLMMTYNPAPVHTSCNSDDVKMIIA